MKAIFVLVTDFFRSGAFVFRRSDRTVAIVIDRLALLGIIPAIGAAILLAIATDIPHAFFRHFLSGLAILLFLASFLAFNRITITSSGVALKFIYGLGLKRKRKSLAYSGGCFSYNLLGSSQGLVLYSEPQLVIPGRLLVPLHFYALFPRQVVNVLNEEILRVSGSSVPKAIVTSSKESAS